MSNPKNFCFKEEVTRQFDFLKEHGFLLVHSEPPFVRFESRRACVNIYHERLSYEIGLNVGPLPNAGQLSYSTSEIGSLLEPSIGSDIYRDFAATTVRGVAEGVQRLAKLLRHYVNLGLFQDICLFERLRENRKTLSIRFERQLRLSQMRIKLDLAWTARDFAEVAVILCPFQSSLTPTEMRKFKYAKKKLD